MHVSGWASSNTYESRLLVTVSSFYEVRTYKGNDFVEAIPGLTEEMRIQNSCSSIEKFKWADTDSSKGARIHTGFFGGDTFTNCFVKDESL